MKEKHERELKAYCDAPQHRALTLERAPKIDKDARTVELSFSSEAPYERWFGVEVLGHRNGEIEMARLEDGGAVLLNHANWDTPVGVVEKTWVDGDKGRAIIRFGKSVRAAEAFEDVIDGILRHVSVGYFVKEMELVKESKEGPDEYRVSRWEPFEISMVSVPADMTVGVGRSGAEPEKPEASQTLIEPEKESKKMTEQVKVDDATRAAEIKAAVADATEAARKAERARVAELTNVGEVYGAEDLAKESVRAGHDIHELNRRILERDGMQATKAETPEIGMDDNDVDKFSFLRLMDALANPSDKEAQRAAGYELDCAAEAARVSRTDVRGAMIPYDVLIARRDMNVGTAIDGGNLVGTDLLGASFIDLLRNSMALNQCGITYLGGLNGNIAIPRQTSGATHYWLAENGNPTESAAAFDQVALTPKTVGAYTEISRKLLKQSSIDAENFAKNELVRTLAIAIDSAGINGTGANNQPTGILSTSSIGDVAGGAAGLAPAWSHIVDLETDVSVANADIGSTCYLTNAKVRGKAKKVFVDAGSGERLWDSRAGGTPFNGYRAVVSNQVPSNLVKGGSGAVCSAIIFGNFADLFLGMWGGLDLQVNPYSLDTKGAVRVTAFQDLDFAVRHPESFSAMQDALT